MAEITNTFFNKKSEKSIEIDVVPLNDIRPFFKSFVEGKYERLDFYLFLHFTNGDGNHFIDFKSYKYQTGSSFFLSRYQVHKWDITDTTDGYLVLFTENFLSKSEDDRELLLNLLSVQRSPKLSDNNSILTESLQVIIREFNKPEDHYKEDILRAQLRVLLLQILRDQPLESSSCQVQRDTTLFNIFRQTLEQNFLTVKTVSEYANLLGVGPKKLNTTIKQFSNTTAKHYIDNRVILEAKRLLSSTYETTQETAYALEFEDPSNFVKFFKRYVGITPSQFQSSLSPKS